MYQHFYLHVSTFLPLIMKIVLSLESCFNGEYKINDQCCPMCDPGKRVFQHCDNITSITCVSCAEMTYTDSSNGLTNCLPCTVCDSGKGLRVKQACKVTSDTVCEPLPGHYCIDFRGKHCFKARKHSSCLPGQYINQTGTEFQDAACADCPAHSYSDGTICHLHTNCKSHGKVTVKSGTKTDDAECSDGHSYISPAVSAMCGVCVLAGIIVVAGIIKKKIHHYSLTDQNDNF